MARHRLARGTVWQNSAPMRAQLVGTLSPSWVSGPQARKFYRLTMPIYSNLHRVQGKALVLFPPAFSRESRAPPEAQNPTWQVFPNLPSKKALFVEFLY